ncbi:MAG TPA: shikimate dehydrogenase [Polyangiaceae bacterium]
MPNIWSGRGLEGPGSPASVELSETLGVELRRDARPVLASAHMSVLAKTRTCAILGHPVGHSLSPAMHNAAFESLSLDYVYVAHDVAPNQLEAAIAGVRALGYRGLSITIPHKVAALSLVDEVDPVAAAIGCINTIVNQDGRLRGYNSDGHGALSALRRADADPSGKHVVVIGSGGAARAITMTLALETPPKQITLLGIVPDELQRLAQDLRASSHVLVETAPLDDQHLSAELEKANILLQTTPVGMAPHSDVSPVPARLLHSGLVVFDAVYTPRRTQLLLDAAKAGARVVEGLEMFIGQALMQFELFTGHQAPLSVMRSAVEARLGN